MNLTRWCRVTHLIPSPLAVLADTAGSTGLHRNTVTSLDMFDILSDWIKGNEFETCH